MYYNTLFVPNFHSQIATHTEPRKVITSIFPCILAVSHFSPMDMTVSLCALLQTQHRGPWASFFVQSRDKPLHILGMIAGVISLMVVVTVFISTIMFMRNKKSNRIDPAPPPHPEAKQTTRDLQVPELWRETPNPRTRGHGGGQL